MPKLYRDHLLDEIIQFALLLPRDPDYYDHPGTMLRNCLLDLADSYRAMTKSVAERLASQEDGKPAQKRADTPAERADAQDGESHARNAPRAWRAVSARP